MLICKEKCDYFWKHGQHHQCQHLTNCLKAAQEQEDNIAEQNILGIIKRKKDKAFWRRLNYALGKHVCGQSVRTVQVKDGSGGVLDFNTKEAVQARLHFPVFEQDFFREIQESVGFLRNPQDFKNSCRKMKKCSCF